MTLSAAIAKHPWAALAAGGLLSLAGYWVTFGLIVDRPLTSGAEAALLQRKIQMLEAAGPGKVVVLAGSNGRYSHSCAVIGAALDRPCTNVSVTAGIAPDLLFQETAPRLRAGDIVYMPMEYSVWSASDRSLYADTYGPWLFRHRPRALAGLPAWHRGWSGFAFDLRYVFEAAAEMALDRMGLRRREGLQTMNALGDETGATAERATAYAAAIRAMPWNAPQGPRVGGAGERQLRAFVNAARARGATVIGGLPTTFDDRPIPQTTVDAVAAVFARCGAQFIVLPNRSQYPRSAFFDTPYHLQQPSALAHSRLVAAALSSLVPAHRAQLMPPSTIRVDPTT